jgi:hypothetical protein
VTWQKHKAESRKRKAIRKALPLAALRFCVFVLILAAPAWAPEPDLAALCADRTAVERVYYNHRTGTKPPFEETLPAEALRRLVQTDLAKEAALKNVYGLEVTAAMLAAEVQRINTTTRAPEILAELKAALGNDTDRFARTIAKPIVVERLLHNRFENDDKLHASQRREAEKVRAQLLAARSSRGDEALAQRSEVGGQRSETDSKPEIRNPKSETNPKLESRNHGAGSVSNLVGILKTAGLGQFNETTWQLGARRPDTNTPSADELEIKKRFGPDAQPLSSPAHGGDERKLYFDDLPSELQRVLRVQLRQAGDVSAVIEIPGAFLLYVCKERTAEALTVATLSLPKRGYEEWLGEQSKGAQ